MSWEQLVAILAILAVLSGVLWGTSHYNFEVRTQLYRECLKINEAAAKMESKFSYSMRCDMP